MNLKVIGTGSKGNAYLLENDSEALLIECGVRYADILSAMDFNLSNVTACIVTHEHQDHSKSIKKLMDSGVDVWASKGTHFASKTLHHHRSFVMTGGSEYKIRNFRILPFDVHHDAEEPLGFLINHPETGNVLFMTDTFYSGWTFSGLNNIILGVNYDTDIIREKLEGKQFLKKRIMYAHMSIKTALQLFKANDISAVNNIVLTHLSDSNSNEKDFIKQVRELTGKSVTVADDGLIMQLNKTPF